MNNKNLFKTLWLDMAEKLIDEGKKYGGVNSVEYRINRIKFNSLDRLNLIQELYSNINLDSKEVTNKIMKTYYEHFNFFISKCNNYKTVINLVGFWEELPARFEEVLGEVKSNFSNTNKLIKLKRQDIEERYEGKPIFIVDREGENWYIVNDSFSRIPTYMLAPHEVDLYDKDESNIEGIELVGMDCERSYAMWIYFNKDDGWQAYGYE